MANFFGRTHRRPTWRRRGRVEGFRIVAVTPGDMRRVSRNVGEVRVPKIGWVRFRWHVAFAVVPKPIAAPGTANGWGLLVTRLEHKAPGRVVKVDPRFTSQRCSACGIVDRETRESQAAFRCRSCGLAANADVNAARDIRFAAGHAVTAWGGPPLGGPANREPQHDLLLVRVVMNRRGSS